MGVGLARVTIAAPRRRVDLALPDQIPLAELLPDLLRHAGESLADQGERHGGWLLRRPDGAALLGGRPLRAQGVRDGEILHLTPASTFWPAPEYDDVVDVIAGAPRRTGPWSPAATRIATRAAAVALMPAALPPLLLAPSPAGAYTAVALTIALLLAAVTASRAYGDAGTAAVLGALALPFAGAGGALLAAAGRPAPGFPAWWGAPETLVATVAVLLAAVLAAVGTAVHPSVPVAFASAALQTVPAAALALLIPALHAVHAAALLAAAAVCTLGLLPLLAIRLGRLPIPAIAMPAGPAEPGDPGLDGPGDARWRPSREPGDPGLDGLREARRRPPREAVLAALSRTDEFLTGLLAGHALVITGAALVLAVRGGAAARVLAASVAVSVLLRTRVLVTTHHRVPLLVAGTAVLLALAVATPIGSASPVAAALPVAVALSVLVAGAAWSRRPPSLYLARAAELLDTAALVSLVPLACVVLGLYASLRNLNG
ncbi:type VII secretion integral membrane protein EccD [Catenuloplanes indicus]|uniref:Type VII secretion integral membrane protein EccD n=1 Tax=Catenuloplanes indicus TaxID=137267 RepID=A0AAE4AZR8_9ACTN|nr:type VII secretion integral membrane protein EccD [Catenuloplanes indicus]MDQ0368026.1 type VII secretion integral membrane protein EccD [Catenuloplanes indicus]